jgi:hypothetical protein
MLIGSSKGFAGVFALGHFWPQPRKTGQVRFPRRSAPRLDLERFWPSGQVFSHMGGGGGVRFMTFDELSDLIMGPVLDRMPREEQAKLLLLLRQTVSRSGQAWIDKELKKRKLESVATP